MKTKKFDEMEEEERAKAAFSTLYEGYVVDLIKALSKQVKFKYEMYIVADGNYGALNEQTGKWNGMIADLINHVSSALVIGYIISLLQFISWEMFEYDHYEF